MDKKQTVIIVDDVNFHLLSIKERLKKHYDIYPAQSTEIMFEILENVKPDMILLDINMPESDGFETLERLKADPRYADIPTAFLTAKNDKKSAARGMSLGAVDFLTKPVSDNQLIDCIEYHLDPNKKLADKPIILAIDDDPSILKSINYLLTEEYKVYVLPKPEQIKELLKMITPDLFLLDCKMPVLSGFDLVPIIRDTPGHEETPIIFLSTEGTIDNISVAIHLGACDFVIKPIDGKILHEKLSSTLSNYKMMRRIRAL